MEESNMADGERARLRDRISSPIDGCPAGTCGHQDGACQCAQGVSERPGERNIGSGDGLRSGPNATAVQKRVGACALESDVSSRLKWLNPSAYVPSELVVVKRSTDEWRYAEVLSVAQDGIQLRVGTGLTKDVSLRLLGSHVGKLANVGIGGSREEGGASHIDGAEEAARAHARRQRRRRLESAIAPDGTMRSHDIAPVEGPSAMEDLGEIDVEVEAMAGCLHRVAERNRRSRRAVEAAANRIPPAVFPSLTPGEVENPIRGPLEQCASDAAGKERGEQEAKEQNLKGFLSTLDCPICLEATGLGRALFVTECGHLCHFECMKKNYRHGNLSCPLCRHHLRESPTQVQTSPPRRQVPSVEWNTVGPGMGSGTVSGMGPGPGPRRYTDWNERRDLLRARRQIAEQRAVALEMVKPLPLVYAVFGCLSGLGVSPYIGWIRILVLLPNLPPISWYMKFVKFSSLELVEGE